MGSARLLGRLAPVLLAAAAACTEADRPTAPAGGPAEGGIAAGPGVRVVAEGPRPSVVEARTLAGDVEPGPVFSADALPAGAPSDIVWHRTGTGDFGIWFMDAGRALPEAEQGWTPFSVSSGWELEAVADFDADGDPDLVFHQTGTGNFGVWLMDGATLLPAASAWRPFVASNGWDIVDAADFDADGYPDLVFRNTSLGAHGIWKMTGPTPRSDAGAWVQLSASPGWHVDVVADFDASGGPDVLWHQTGTGNFGVLRMNGTSPRPNPPGCAGPPCFDANWAPFGASVGWEPIDAADFGADASIDLLMRNPNTGEHGIWLMSGSRPNSAAQAWIPLGASPGWSAVAATDFGAVTPTTFSSLGTGSTARHACFVRSDAALFCRGENGYGQLGDGTTFNRLTAATRVVGMPAGVSRVTQGTAHTCAALVSGQVYCWGYTGAGSVPGNPSATTTTRPIAVPMPQGASGFTRVAAGNSHTCGLATGGVVYCWGSGTAIGVTGGTGNVVTPRPVPMPNGVTSFTDVASGADHSCALADTGAIHCWGGNSYGQRGTADGTLGHPNPAPLQNAVPFPSGVTAFGTVVASESVTCAVASVGPNAGQLYCWGRNCEGKLGSSENYGCPSTAAVPTPRQVLAPTGLTSWGSAAGGFYHSCGVAATGAVAGRVFCWGGNQYFQSGQASQASSQYAQVVNLPAGVTGFTEVATGFEHSCGITNTGTLYCWGSGSRTPTAVPLP